MLTLLLLACRPPEATAVPWTPATDVRAVAWMAGRWAGPQGASTETWIDRDHALFGVAFAPGPEGTWFEVLLIDEVDTGPISTFPMLGFTAWPGGAAPTTFTSLRWGPSAIGFSHPTHDFPQRISYEREGERLTATVSGATGEAIVWKGRAEPLSRVDEVEEADRRFAADSATRGVAAWTDVLDAKGAFWMGSDVVLDGKGAHWMGSHLAGPELTAVLGPALEAHELEWAPVASGLAPAGDLAFTVGDYHWAAADGGVGETGSYVSVWRKQPDGGWKVLFDAGAPR